MPDKFPIFMKLSSKVGNGASISTSFSEIDASISPTGVITLKFGVETNSLSYA